MSGSDVPGYFFNVIARTKATTVPKALIAETTTSMRYRSPAGLLCPPSLGHTPAGVLGRARGSPMLFERPVLGSVAS